MRIVTWNCNGAFRRKFEALDALDADVLVVQECEDPAQSSVVYRDWAGSCLWKGNGKNKGIGIFPRKGQSIEILDWNGMEYQIFLPVRLDGNLNVLGVWTQNASPSSIGYIGQFWHFLQSNLSRLTPDTIILGDFNSNTIWDKPRRKWNHTDCVGALSDLGFSSLYHRASGDLQGRETVATFHFYRKQDKPFHIDFVFAHASKIDDARLQVKIGNADPWLKLSDHLPVVVDL